MIRTQSEGQAPKAAVRKIAAPLEKRFPQLVHMTRRSIQDPTMALQGARLLVSPAVFYLDRHSDAARAVTILSSARSGSTILAEVLVQAGPFRLIFEPLRGDRVAASRLIRWGHYVDPQIGDPLVAAVLDRVVTGRIRGLWCDRYNASRLPQGRVIKEIRATNLAPLIAKRYPQMPLIYLLRHPLATAVSASDLGWDDRLDEFLGQESLMSGPLAAWRDIIERAATTVQRNGQCAMVLRWCLENLVPLTALRSGDAHVVFYENLVCRPDQELHRLWGYLRNRCPEIWDHRTPAVEALAKPSATSYRDGRASALSLAERKSDWQDRIDTDTRRRCLGLLAVFGFERLYSDEVAPRVAAEEVLET
jgi:hypothetical protein